MEMATNYSARYSKPIAGNRHSQGGAALNLDVGCLQGESDMITVFDDFNHVMESMAPADTDGFEECGWVVTDANTATAATLGMNDPIVAANGFDSCIRLNAGTKADSGISMQLDHINADMLSTADELTTLSGRYNFPHMWIPDATTATGLDYTTWTFACRVGFETANATGSWATGGKFFIGWAENGDTSIMTNATGVITIASGGPLIGFHIPEDGSIDGICHRTAATAMAEGTNFTELQPTLAVDSTLANGVGTIGDIVWWDLALRMNIGDNSEAVNGVTEFFTRRVYPEAAATNPGASELSLNPLGPWVRHGTVLENQTPANTAAQGALVPTIEALNGPTDDCDFYVDWWSFGCSRYSRGRR
jgi:hypothetical protein